MIKNYYILNRLVCELRDILVNQRVTGCFTQERDRLYIGIPNDENPNRHLIISTDHNLPFLVIKNDFQRAKKNTINIFQQYFPNKFHELMISLTDRIIKFTLNQGEMYFFIRGHRTNVIYLDENGNLNSFKKIPDSISEEFISEIRKTEWSNSFNLPDFSSIPENIVDYDQLRKSFPTLGVELKRELSARHSSITPSMITMRLTEIAVEPFSVSYSEELGKVILSPSTSPLFIGHNNLNAFNRLMDAVNFYVSYNFRSINKRNLKSEIEKYLSKELVVLSNKLNKLKKRIEDGSKEEEYNRIGNLLLANIQLLKKGFSEIKLRDFESDEEIIIELNTKIPPRKNVEYYFLKSKDEKLNYAKSLEIFEQTKNKYQKLLTIANDLENIDSDEELKRIHAEQKIKNNSGNKQLEDQIKYRHFVLDTKYDVFVGRDNKNNDLVTFKLAKQNDLWFHARGVPGSHVVLKVDNKNEPVPKNIIKDVAGIAAYFSKAKNAGVVPVSYTFRKYVRKGKGMEPGKVLMEREIVLHVRPEIPANCEQVEE